MLIHDLRKKLNKGKDPWPYDLLTVHIGREKLESRAIAWSDSDFDGFGHNKKGIMIEQSKWHMTCPKCAQLIEFNEKHVAIDGDKILTYCNACGANRDVVCKLQDAVRAMDHVAKVAHLLDRVDEIVANRFYINTTQLFINPIATGAMKI